MKDTPLFKAGIVSFVLMIIVIAVSFALGDRISSGPICYAYFSNEEESGDEELTVELSEEDEQPEVWEEEKPKYKAEALINFLGSCDPELVDRISESCVIVNKDFFAPGTSVDYEISYVDRTITFELDSEYRDSQNIWTPLLVRTCGDTIFEKTPMLKSDFDRLVENDEEIPVTDDPVICSQLEIGEERAILTLGMSRLTEYELYEDEHYIYVGLIDPRSLSDRILVVDAGHGGPDSGTLAGGEGNYEKDFNLSIVTYLKELLDADPTIRTYYTRTDDRRLTLPARVNLANDLGADFFVSVHCNSSEKPKIGGTEVLYNQHMNDMKPISPKEFAGLLLDGVQRNFPIMNRGLVARGDDVLILKEAKVPAALVETAYLSNRDNLEQMKLEENRRAIAKGIYEAILEAFAVKEQAEQK